MSDQPKTLSLQQLSGRITALEQENSRLRKELGEMNAQLMDLGAAFKAEVTNVTAEFKFDRTQLKQIHQYLTDIHDQLWPLVHKVFPGSAKTQQQIAAIKRTGGRSRDNKRS